MEVVDKGTFFHCTVSRMYIFEQWHIATGSEAEKIRHIVQLLLQLVPEDAENLDVEKLRDVVEIDVTQIKKYWKKVNRTRRDLIHMYGDWLNITETVDLPKTTSDVAAAAATSTCRQVLPDDLGNNSKLGRPKKNYASCSKRTQRRRLEELSQEDNSAISSLMHVSSDDVKCEVNVDEILSLITAAKLTKHQYLVIKNFVNSKNNPLLPSYPKVLEAKQRCYPEKQAVTMTEKSAEVELQSLLNHTATRILDSQKDVLTTIPYETLGDVTLIGKWGFDGSTGRHISLLYKATK